MCVFKQEKYIQFCLQDWLVAKYAFKIPLYLFYSISPNSNQPGFPHAQHSTVFQQPVSRFPPSLTNSWVMPIKVPAANTQSSLPSFKPLQCPSCPETNFCQKEKKKYHIHEPRRRHSLACCPLSLLLTTHRSQGLPRKPTRKSGRNQPSFPGQLFFKNFTRNLKLSQCRGQLHVTLIKQVIKCSTHSTEGEQLPKQVCTVAQVYSSLLLHISQPSGK